MPSPFTVAEDPWIPVRIRTDLTADERAELLRVLPAAEEGRRCLVGLRSLFTTAHLIADLDLDHPPVESVLRRMLAAITARVTGLDTGTGDDWLDERDGVLTTGRFTSKAVDAYFDEHAPRFGLHGTPRPFLQDPRLAKECTGGPARPPRHEPGLRKQPRVGQPHARDHALTMADAAGWLLAWHGYGPAGMGAVRTHAGRSTKSCKAGPYRCLISYFPTTPTASSPPSSSPSPPPRPGSPTPATTTPLGNRHPSRPSPPLRPRRPHLPPYRSDLPRHPPHPQEDHRQITGCRVAWGTATDLPTAIDPYVVDREKGGPLRADRTRAVFRDLDALLLKHRPGSKIAVRRPTVFDSIADLPPHTLTTLGIRALGWDQDKQDKNFGWYAATTPPSATTSKNATPTAPPPSPPSAPTPKPPPPTSTRPSPPPGTPSTPAARTTSAPPSPPRPSPASTPWPNPSSGRPPRTPPNAPPSNAPPSPSSTPRPPAWPPPSAPWTPSRRPAPS